MRCGKRIWGFSMGMDLVSKKGKGLSYNWSAWVSLSEFLKAKGISVAEFAGSNDGARIRAQTCRLVADTIERNADEYNRLFGSTIPGADGEKPAAKHAKLWRNSGGFRQL